MTADDIIKAAVESDEAFIKEFARIIKAERDGASYSAFNFPII